MDRRTDYFEIPVRIIFSYTDTSEKNSFLINEWLEQAHKDDIARLVLYAYDGTHLDHKNVLADIVSFLVSTNTSLKNAYMYICIRKKYECHVNTEQLQQWIIRNRSFFANAIERSILKHTKEILISLATEGHPGKMPES